MGFGKVRAVLAGFALALAWIGASVADARAETATVTAAVAPEGYARIVFSFDRLPANQVRLTNNVLVIGFQDPVEGDISPISRALGDIVSVARVDPDRLAIRIALKTPLKFNATEAGEKLFVDLLPTRWTSLPPPLPADVIADLTRQAREGREIKAADERRRALPQEPLTVEGATHPTFRRLIFTVPQDVGVDVKRAGDRVDVAIAAPLPFDLDAARAKLPPEMMGITATRSADGLVVSAPNPGGKDPRGFREDGTYILDIDRDDVGSITPRPAARAAAPADHAPTPPPASGSAPSSPAAAPRAEAVAPTQAKLAEAAAPRAPEPAAPPPAAEAPRADTTNAEAARPAGAAQIKDASVVRSGDTLRLAFPFAKSTPAAIFVRGSTLWVAFDDPAPLDLDRLVAGSGGLILSASQAPVDGGRVGWLKLSEHRLVTASPDGNDWIVSIGEDLIGRRADIDLTPAFGKDGRAAMRAVAAGVGEIRYIRDPEVGDRVAVATLPAPARGLKRPQQFVEFQALPTAQGVALGLSADDVQVSADLDGITIGRDAGLTLSTATDAASSSAASNAPPSEVVLGSDVWADETARPFAARENQLMGAAAMAPPDQRTDARLALARFYEMRSQASGAMGVLDAIVQDDAAAARDPRVAILRGAAAIELDRPKLALAILSEPSLGANMEASLWRAAANAAMGRPGPAREALRQGEPALSRLTPEAQSRFVELGVNLALDAGDRTAAASLMERLEVLPALRGPAAREVLRGRVAEALGQTERALTIYETEARSSSPAAAAEAELRATELSLKSDKAKAPDAIARLERLTADWRGDAIEAEALSQLAGLYTGAERWRDAFATLKVAIEAFPDVESSRALQDKMQDQFTSMFLGGGIDRMSKIDALALFYDFKDLSPSGKRGDELVRRLADKLVDVDLLDQAAELLDYQIDKRLTGAARAQVAARAALVDLMNGKPQNAVEVLRKTRQADLPASLLQSRLVLEARALALTGRADLALEMAQGLEGPDARRLSADILWSARRWGEAGEAIETVLGSSWRDAKPLDNVQRNDVLRAAIALSLANDGLGLDRVRQKFAAKMANSPDAAGFDVVTAPVEARGDAFREVARSIATTAAFDSFLAEYRRRAGEDAPAAASPPERAASTAGPTKA